ncbi:hypothetical protein LTR91_025979 [Friedmanniomyces endolithicus]|uniref:NACHT domain-containing protein n=1 Tax=Friedmanniomyces endolithicus TaxID=329885 RepID=A0AAN6JVG5_9PEZI|nr:hypothetical protein LTR91_025979 [Friedmanniomyces endolithicus]
MMVENMGDPYVVLDALDECKTRSDLLQQLPRLKSGRVCLLLTSRTEEDIVSSLREWIPSSNFVSIRQGPVDIDIREVVRNRIATDPKLRRFKSRPDVCTEIETRLMEKADGMFRWAVCQLDALQACLDLPSLREALQSLPAGLNETYTRILRGIPEMHKARAIRILQFLTFAENPLRLEEMVDAIAVNLEQTPVFEPENRLLDPREITGYCSSLTKFTIRRERRYRDKSDDIDKDSQFRLFREENYRIEHLEEATDEGPDLTYEEVIELQLAHASVNDYLVSDQVPEDFKESLRQDMAQRAIADISVAYLMTAAHTSEGPDNSSSLPFLEYCTDSWAQHAAIAETVGKRCSPWTIRLFTTPEEFKYWAHLHRGFAGNSATALPLSYATYHGLEESVKMLLEKGADIDAGDAVGNSNALVIASREGHESVVRLLLGKGARLFASRALQMACTYSNEAVVRLLLEAGIRDGRALRVASQRGYEAVVQLLLAKDTETNVRNDALRDACENGHEAVVRLLLEKGAVASDALLLASRRGHEAVVRLLLKQVANIDERRDALPEASSPGNEEIARLSLVNADVDADAGFGDALESACRGGHEAVVRLLLEKGACIDNSEALRAACVSGNELIVRLLLQEGADVHTPNALYDAYCRGHEAIVQLLLKEGANANELSEQFGYPLIVASYYGQEAMVRLLLQEGADVNAQVEKAKAEEPVDALEAASYRGHEGIVRLLLKNGAEVDKPGRYWGALQAASSRGYNVVVQLLIMNGADVNAQGGHYGSALCAASDRGYEAVVELLIEKGADVHAKGKYDVAALHSASLRGHEAAVRTLLAKGADVNSQGGPWRNALWAASSGGHTVVVQLLLEAGADDVEDVDKYGNHESALLAALRIGKEKVVQVLQAARANGKGSVPGVNLFREPQKSTRDRGGFWDDAFESV